MSKYLGKNQPYSYTQKHYSQLNSSNPQANLPYYSQQNSQKQQSIFCQNESPLTQKNAPREKQNPILNTLTKKNQFSSPSEEQNQVSHSRSKNNEHPNQYYLRDYEFQNHRQRPFQKKKILRKSQNLKNISKYLMVLITFNKNLSVKEISYLLFEIIGQTEFGLELANQKKPIISSETKRRLTQKYDDEQNAEPEVQNLIKNVRRRLYDALNVMISSNIVSKTNKRIHMFHNRNSLSSKREQIIQCKKRLFDEKLYLNDTKQNLLKKIKETQLNIQRKRNLLQRMKKHSAMIKLLLQTNQQDQSLMSQNLFPIPLTVIQVESGMEIEIEEEIFTIKSSYIKIHSDMDVLELLFEKNVETEEKFVESERKIDCKRSS